MVKLFWRGGRAWFNAHDSKSCVPQGTGGSNPSLSASFKTAFEHIQMRFLFFLVESRLRRQLVKRIRLGNEDVARDGTDWRLPPVPIVLIVPIVPTASQLTRSTLRRYCPLPIAYSLLPRLSAFPLLSWRRSRLA